MQMFHLQRRRQIRRAPGAGAGRQQLQQRGGNPGVRHLHPSGAGQSLVACAACPVRSLMYGRIHNAALTAQCLQSWPFAKVLHPQLKLWEAFICNMSCRYGGMGLTAASEVAISMDPSASCAWAYARAFAACNQDCLLHLSATVLEETQPIYRAAVRPWLQCIAGCCVQSNVFPTCCAWAMTAAEAYSIPSASHAACIAR